MLVVAACASADTLPVYSKPSAYAVVISVFWKAHAADRTPPTLLPPEPRAHHCSV